MVRLKSRGLFRQEWTKTDAGYRIVVLPGFAVDMLKRLQNDPKYGRMCAVKALRQIGGDVVEVDDQTPLVFPGRGGVLRDLHNFSRTWRDARGTQGITERHYIASAELAPDSSAVLEKGLGRIA